MRVKITIVIGLVAGGLASCSIDDKIQKKKDDDKKSSSSDATEGAGRFKDPEYLCVPAEDEAVDEGEAELHLADASTWDGGIATLVEKKCVACHGTGGKPYDPDLTNFDATKAAGEAVVQQVVDGLMPTAGALPDAETAQFQSWKDGGFLKAAAAAKPAPKNDDVLESNRCPVPADEPAGDDGAADDGTGGGATLVGYDQLQSFIDGKCVACHGTGGKPYAPDLTGYANAKSGGARSNVRIQANTMPPGGGLSADEQALFQKWVDGGYAEQGE